MSESPGQNWAVYEANVQQYRVISATVQSFLLTVGTILFAADAPNVLLALLVLLGVTHVFYVWMPIIWARNYIVDYYKYQRDLLPDRRRKLQESCSEDKYCTDAVARRDVNREYFNEMDLEMLRTTRFKLDLCVPVSYVAVWAMLALWRIGGFNFDLCPW